MDWVTNMTRKDYVLLAEVIKGRADNVRHLDALAWTEAEQKLALDVLADLTDFLSYELSKDNKAFDPQRFIEACGVASPQGDK